MPGCSCSASTHRLPGARLRLRRPRPIRAPACGAACDPPPGWANWTCRCLKTVGSGSAAGEARPRDPPDVVARGIDELQLQFIAGAMPPTAGCAVRSWPASPAATRGAARRSRDAVEVVVEAVLIALLAVAHLDLVGAGGLPFTGKRHALSTLSTPPTSHERHALAPPPAAVVELALPGH